MCYIAALSFPFETFSFKYYIPFPSSNILCRFKGKPQLSSHMAQITFPRFLSQSEFVLKQKYTNVQTISKNNGRDNMLLAFVLYFPFSLFDQSLYSLACLNLISSQLSFKTLFYFRFFPWNYILAQRQSPYLLPLPAPEEQMLSVG